ncbi:MAG: type II toxin-antitoxin system RelE/ParE family toxin [Candidatus Aminicenantes bacterium]|nr:type II toxin-antitoxin system RelE/ParE family toxin [Candidatus Aminicenantes bacterium]
MKRKVFLYETENGKCPVREFILSLQVKVQREIAKILKLLEDVEILSEPYFKKLRNSGEIWEARKRFGSNSYRVLFFFDQDSVVILTNGFVKKKQKTPREEISRAKRYKKDYLRRKK